MIELLSSFRLLSALVVILLGCWKPQPTAQSQAVTTQTANQMIPKADSEAIVNQPIDKGDSDSLPFTKKHLSGHFQPSKDSLFRLVPESLCNAKGMYLRRETLEAFVRMHAAAKKAGITLTIISATRNFDDQKRIWEDKWTGKRLVDGKNLQTAIPDPVKRAREILKYSSMPGTSRHHWGTDFDMNNLQPAWWDNSGGKPIYEWLENHAAEFGFHQPYSKKGPERSTGYEEEKWHWSFTALSAPMLKAYTDSLSYKDITGFLGSETAKELGMIENYVKGVKGN